MRKNTKQKEQIGILFIYIVKCKEAIYPAPPPLPPNLSVFCWLLLTPVLTAYQERMAIVKIKTGFQRSIETSRQYMLIGVVYKAR